LRHSLDVVLNAAEAFFFKDKHHADFDFEFKEASAAFKNVTGKSVERQHLYRWLEPAAGKPVRADILRL